MNGIETADRNPPIDVVELCEELLRDYYKQDIAKAVAEQHDSITVDYADLYRKDPDLATDLVNNPHLILAALRRAVEAIETPIADSGPVLEELDVRVAGVDAPEPIVSNLRGEPHLGKYIGLRGQVSLATQVQPKLMEAVFNCQRCGDAQNPMRVGPITQYGEELQLPAECPSCERQGPFTLLESESTYLDHQIVELTDPPGENPGDTNNVVPVHLYGELAGVVSPGDRVRINGIAETKQTMISNASQKHSRRQDWQLLGHAIDEEETAFEEVEPERVDEIQAVPEKYTIPEVFIDSFAPEILTGERGDKHKLALMLALFGGSSESDRDDINVFLIGAPGTGKSEYLKRARQLAPKAVEASGKGASAAGLTASATKSETTGKWMLDAGALVLASGGVACIDEFDKMKSETRKSMHTAMENQRVPINKAGINTSLTTETTVIAAANPDDGSFNRFTPVVEQVDIDDALLSRFDLIFGFSDTVDEDRDAAIAAHQHDRVEETVSKPLEDELITEYIAYARQNYDPTYASEEPKEALVDYYAEKRQESASEDENTMPITPRMNDSLRRLAQASARMHLRDEITMADAEIAMELMDMRLGDTALDDEGNLDGARMEGRTTHKDKIDIVYETVNEADGAITPKQVASRTPLNEENAEHYINNLSGKGEVYEPETNKYDTT